MKRLLLIIFLFEPFWGMAQSTTGSVNFHMDVCRFYNKRLAKTIAELYFAVDGTSIGYKKDKDGMFQASVNINWQLQQVNGNDSIDIAGDNYNLQWGDSERLADTTLADRRKTLFNMQQVDLDPGEYILRSIVVDNYSPSGSKRMAINEFEIADISPGEFAFSDIKWVAQDNSNDKLNTRHDLIPLVTNDAFIDQDSIVFFQEIYNSDQVFEGAFFYRAHITQNDNVLWNYEVIKKRTPNYFNAIPVKIMIPKLKSNTYHLHIELLNEKNRPIKSYKKKFFVYNSRVEPEFDQIVASNRETDMFNKYSEEQLDYYIQTLTHRSTEQEQNFTKVLSTKEHKKSYLYSWLEKRKDNPDQKILDLWNGHQHALEYVNQQFESAWKEGWQTDRGRVFMRFGIPSDVERYPAEASTIPYEIWRYDRLGTQSNVIFIFYDSDLASNDYALLHSSKYGEVNNPRWKSVLHGLNKGLTPSGLDYEEDRNSDYDTKINPDD